MSKENKSKQILKYLYNKGPTFSSELEKIFLIQIPRSTFYYYLKQLKNKELINLDTIKEKTRTRIKYSISKKGIEFIQSDIDKEVIKLKIDYNKMEKYYFQLISQIEKTIPISKKRKIEIFLTWSFINNNITNYVANESLFAKIKLLMLLNLLHDKLEQKDVTGYNKYSKIFNLKEIELKFYVNKIIEQSNLPGNFPDWHKIPISSDKDVFYSFSFGYGKVLYSQIIYYLKSDLSFNPIFNIFPRELIGKVSPESKEKLEELFSNTSLEKYFQAFFDYEKEIIKNSALNLKFFLKKFFDTEYLKIIINFVKNIPYEKFAKTQEWQKNSEKLIFPSFFLSFKEKIETSPLFILQENNALITVAKELIIALNLKKFFLKVLNIQNKEDEIHQINNNISFLNKKITQISEKNENTFNILSLNKKDDTIFKEIGKIQESFNLNLDEIDNKYFQLINLYNFHIRNKLKIKSKKNLLKEIQDFTSNK